MTRNKKQKICKIQIKSNPVYIQLNNRLQYAERTESGEWKK